MTRVSTPTQPERPAPLLYSPCTCRFTPKTICVACARWFRHYRNVTERLSAWRTQR